MRAVYERFKDPREEGFSDPDRWDGVSTLGHAGRKYATEQEIYDAARAREPAASANAWPSCGRGRSAGPAQRGVLRCDVLCAEVADARAHRVRGERGRRPQRG